MTLTPKMIGKAISDMQRRAFMARCIGGISALENAEGAPIPAGWVLDPVIDYFLPFELRLTDQ